VGLVCWIFQCRAYAGEAPGPLTDPAKLSQFLPGHQHGDHESGCNGHGRYNDSEKNLSIMKDARTYYKVEKWAEQGRVERSYGPAAIWRGGWHSGPLIMWITVYAQ
jgi:hypothetical protein